MRILRLTWKAYRLLIWVYPPDLRKAHGAEMEEVFRRQTLDAWEHGTLALVKVLECAAVELFACALPWWAQSRAAIASATSLLFTSAFFLSLLWVVHNPMAVQHISREVNRAISQTARWILFL